MSWVLNLLAVSEPVNGKMKSIDYTPAVLLLAFFSIPTEIAKQFDSVNVLRRIYHKNTDVRKKRSLTRS